MPLVVRKDKSVAYSTATGRKKVAPYVLTNRERLMAQAFSRAVARLSGSVGDWRVLEAIKAQNTDAVVDALNWTGFLSDLGPIPGQMVREAVEEAQRAVRDLPRMLATDVTLRFDKTDPRAVAWAQVKTGELVTNVQATTREAIRQTIAESFTNQISVDDTAVRLRRVVGLLPRHAVAVNKFHDNLLSRLLSEGMDPAEAAVKAADRTSRYRQRLVRYRSKMIARTETMHASNMGRLLGWSEAADSGLLVGGMDKEWLTAPMASRYGPPCEVCGPMNGQRVAWDAPFSNGVLMPPAHPHCRCTAIPRVKSIEELRGAQQPAQPPEPEPEAFAWAAPQSQGLLVDVVKHLPGKHDQRTHGRKGGVSGGFTQEPFDEEATRARWRSSLSGRPGEREDRYVQNQRTLHEANAPFVLRSADGTTITVEFDGPLLSRYIPARDALLADIEHLQQVAPVGPGRTVKVKVKEQEFRGMSYGVRGWTDMTPHGSPDTATIALRPEDMMEGRTGALGSPGHLMPSANTEQRRPSAYFLTHEWGHVRDRRDDQTAIDQALALNGLDKVDIAGGNSTRGGLSLYGLSSQREAYAESFAEYHLTGGKSTLPAVRHYADLNDWDSNVAKAAGDVTIDADMVGSYRLLDTFDESGPIKDRSVAKHGDPSRPGYAAMHPNSRIGVHSGMRTDLKNPAKGNATLVDDATTMDALSTEHQHKIRTATADVLHTDQTQIEANIEATLARAGGADAPGRDWYDEAHAEAVSLGDEVGISHEQAASMLAAASPQQPWGDNVTSVQYTARALKRDDEIQVDLLNGDMATKRVGGQKVTKSRMEWARAEVDGRKMDGQKRVFPSDDELRGKRLSDLDPYVAAAIVKAHAQAGYHVPGGKSLATIDDVTGRAKNVGWTCGTLHLGRAVRIQRGDSSNDVLNGHKVRSFRNNIVDPHNRFDDITVDSHAFSVGMGRKFGSGSDEYNYFAGKQWKGGPKAVVDTKAGVKGLYPLFADAYRAVGRRHGLSARQVQAITWVQWRKDYPDRVRGAHLREDA